MLELKPNCELCDIDLPPDSTFARICTYECTFCASCVEQVLQNVCPNCGGGLTPRPIRPTNEWRTGVSLHHHGASSKRVLSKYSRAQIEEFALSIKSIDPTSR